MTAAFIDSVGVLGWGSEVSGQQAVLGPNYCYLARSPWGFSQCPENGWDENMQILCK